MAAYQIRKEDMLSEIAKQHGTTQQANLNKIYAGQNANIPGGTPVDGNEIMSRGYASAAPVGAGGIMTGRRESTAPQYNKSDATNDAYNKWKETESNKPGDYNESDALKKLREELEAAEKKKPGAYESAYQEQIDQILNSILNRGEFSYDPAKDKLYQSMADQYRQKGQLAMRDTMGNAAALTGGYGSSYAATAGSQAYDDYMQRLQDRVPELYQMALQSWQNETNSMYGKLNALNAQDDAAYGRYRDSVSDWRNDRDYLYNRTRDQYDTEYGQWRDSIGDWQNDRGYAMDAYTRMSDEDYRKYRDALDQYNRDREFEYQKEKDAREYELAKQKAASAKSSGGSSKKSSSGTTPKAAKDFAPYNTIVYTMKTKGSTSAQLSYINTLLKNGKITESTYTRLCNEAKGGYTPGYAK